MPETLDLYTGCKSIPEQKTGPSRVDHIRDNSTIEGQMYHSMMMQERANLLPSLLKDIPKNTSVVCLGDTTRRVPADLQSRFKEVLVDFDPAVLASGADWSVMLDMRSLPKSAEGVFAEVLPRIQKLLPRLMKGADANITDVRKQMQLFTEILTQSPVGAYFLSNSQLYLPKEAIQRVARIARHNIHPEGKFIASAGRQNAHGSPLGNNGFHHMRASLQSAFDINAEICCAPVLSAAELRETFLPGDLEDLREELEKAQNTHLQRGSRLYKIMWVWLRDNPDIRFQQFIRSEVDPDDWIQLSNQLAHPLEGSDDIALTAFAEDVLVMSPKR